MSVRYRRLAMAAGITAAVIAVPAAALASGSGSPSGKPAAPHARAAGASTSKASHAGAITSPTRSRLAASAGISTGRLQAGLLAAKRAGGGTVAVQTGPPGSTFTLAFPPSPSPRFAM